MLRNALFKYLSGSDIFISYRWSVLGKQYALRLRDELDKRGLKCYIDEKELPRGEIVPASIRNAIRRSRMFVLLVTDDLPASKWIPNEIALAQKFQRKIVPINVAAALEQLVPEDERWLPLKDRSRIEEFAEALNDGVPSKHVAEQIDQSYVFTRRRVAAVRWLFAVGSLFFALSFIAVGAAVYAVRTRERARVETDALMQDGIRLRRDNDEAQRQKVQAENAMHLAEEARTAAETSRNAALAAKTTAEAETAKAYKDRRQAQVERAQAVADAATAKTAKTVAETVAAQANADAKEQTRRAEEQTRIAEEQEQRAAEATRRAREAMTAALSAGGTRINASLGDFEQLRLAVKDTLQNRIDWKDMELPMPERLHEALTAAALSTREQGMGMGVGGYPIVEDFDISPIGNLLFTVGVPRPPTVPWEQSAATLWDVRTRRLLWELPPMNSKTTACAISYDSSLLAVGYQSGEVKFFTVKGAKVNPLRTMTFAKPIAAIKFASVGAHAVINVGGGGGWTGKGFLRADPHAGTQHLLRLPAEANWLEFGNNQRRFNKLQQAPAFIGAFDRGGFEGGLRFTAVNTATSESRGWDINQKHLRKITGEYWFIKASAVGPDGRWLAIVPDTSEAQGATLLFDLPCLDSPQSKCVPVYRLPAPGDRAEMQLAFDPSGKRLLIGEDERRLHVYEIAAVQQSPEAQPRVIEVPAKFSIMGFSSDGNRVVLLVRNGLEAEPRQLRTYTIAGPNETTILDLGPGTAWYALKRVCCINYVKTHEGSRAGCVARFFWREAIK